jgi:prevent-host-death family protein
MKTATVGIKEAKIYLSKYLKIVGQGMEVILTDRGVPVGKIVPIPPDESSLAQRLKKLEQEGVIGRRPTHGKTEQQFPLAVPSGIAQQFLQEDRENG